MGHDFSYTQNRELSWLSFNERVLEESTDTSVPLFERLKFVAIFTSNLDEFFMVRVGGLYNLSLLKKEPVDNKSNQTPTQQLNAIFTALPRLMNMRTESFNTIENQLKNYGITRVTDANLSEDDKKFLFNSYRDTVLPILSPQIIDPRHPFPNLRNAALYLVCSIQDADKTDQLGVIEVPSTLNRVIYLPSAGDQVRYILLEDAMKACCDHAFGNAFTIKERAVIRVTRNADINPDNEIFDEDGDYRQHMKRVLKKRLRLQPVRLEVEGSFPEKHIKYIRKVLGISSSQVFKVTCPLELGYIFGLESKVPRFAQSEILYRPFSPQPTAEFDYNRSIMEQIEERDRLLFFPYESMNPFLELIHEAAYDPSVISIKMTLYRIATKSKLAESLIAAAENGKEVTILMELRARFDEQNNIEWAERLEDAGCIVSYGQEGFKVHSKICQITRRVNGKITRITQLGTGNYNEKTAKLYSDISLMTAHPGIGEDANTFFRNLSLSNLDGEYRVLGVAPRSLKPLILEGISREIEKAQNGQPAQIHFKMNSLTDRDVIDKLSEASCAGVQVKLIIRGISCLLPGIPGKTENIEIRTIVGRFLEHARIYSFGVNADTVYCSSADMMTRNTEHRTEIAFPILDPCIRKTLIDIFDTQLKDNVKARILGPDGVLRRVERSEGDQDCDSQEIFMAEAVRRAAGALLSEDNAHEQRSKLVRKPTERSDIQPGADGSSDGSVSVAVGEGADADKTAPAPAGGSPMGAAHTATDAQAAGAAQHEDAGQSESQSAGAHGAKKPATPKRGRFAQAGSLFKAGFKALFGKHTS